MKDLISHFIFRVDANTEIGYGHLMRCIAMAQELRLLKIEVSFLVSKPSENIKKRLKDEGLACIPVKAVPGSIEDAGEIVKYANSVKASWIGVDGYQFNEKYQKFLKNKKFSLFFIDDYGHCGHYFADMVLNQNISAAENYYKSREDYTELLLGTDYVLLRKEFRAYGNFKRKISGKAKKILITIGGSDPYNITLKALEGVRKTGLKNLEVKIVAGGANPNVTEIENFACKSGLGLKVEVLKDVRDMSEIMAWADIAVSGGGSTCWELALLGLPMLVTAWADNQKPIAAALGKKDIAVNLGWHEKIAAGDIAKELKKLILSSELRKKMSENGQKTIDGMSTRRVVDTLLIKSIVMRNVKRNDCRLLWKWVNDPAVRKASYKSDFIPLEEHMEWFKKHLKDSNSYHFIASDMNGEPLGQVRFDLKNTGLEVAISIAPEKRGMGYAPLIIRKGLMELKKKLPDFKTVTAFIKLDNTASLRSFEKARFIKTGEEVKNGSLSAVMKWEKKVSAKRRRGELKK